MFSDISGHMLPVSACYGYDIDNLRTIIALTALWYSKYCVTEDNIVFAIEGSNVTL